VDFHDDLRGLLVDRRRRRAYPIGAPARRFAAVDAGNFLAHAVLEGRIAELRWVHDIPGGRAWDMGIVRYETDLAAVPSRLRRALSAGAPAAVPLVFEEELLDSWRGLRAGERLSIDWDCFASVLLDEPGIGQRVSSFLDRLGAVVPPDVYLAYSPDYSRPSLDAFRDLATELGRRFAQPLRWVSPGLVEGRLHPSGVIARPSSAVLPRLILFLRRRGIY
jgi:hypothetical protein